MELMFLQVGLKKAYEAIYIFTPHSMLEGVG